MSLPPLPDDLVLKRSIVDSVKPIVQRLVEAEDLQEYLSRRPLQRNESPTHGAAAASPPPPSPHLLSPPPDVDSPRLAGLSSASKSTEHETRVPLPSDMKYSGAITEVARGDTLFRDLTGVFWEELDKLKVWYGDTNLPTCDPYFFGRDRARRRALRGECADRACGTGSEGYPRSAGVRLEVKRPETGPPAVLDALLAYGRERAQVQMAAGLAPDWRTASDAGDKVNLTSPSSTSKSPPTSASPVPSLPADASPDPPTPLPTSTATSASTSAPPAVIRRSTWKTTAALSDTSASPVPSLPADASPDPPTPLPTSTATSASTSAPPAVIRRSTRKTTAALSDSPTLSAIRAISGVLDSSSDGDHAGDSDYQDSASDTDSPALSVGPANSATTSPPPPVSRKNPRPKHWTQWSITTGGVRKDFQQLDPIGRHTLLLLQQVGTQFGEEVWSIVASEEQERLKKRWTQQTKGAKGKYIKGKQPRASTEEIRPLFLDRIGATTDSQMLLTPNDGLPLLRIGSKLHVGPRASSGSKLHGTVSLQLIILCLLDLGKALGIDGDNLTGRLRSTFAKITSASHLHSMSPNTPSASPASSAPAATDSSAAPPPSAINPSSSAALDHAGSNDNPSDAGDSSLDSSTSDRMLEDLSFDSSHADNLPDEIASPVSSVHPSPKRSPPVAPKDAVKQTHRLLVDGYGFTRRGATGGSSSFEVVLEDQVGSGAGGDVYIDSSGTLAVKVIVPRDDESRDAYEDRWDEGKREVEALKHLKGCAVAPELYGVFERTDDEGYRWMVIVSERIHGKRCGDSEFKQYRLDIASTLIRLHTCGIIHGDVRPPNVLITDDLEIKFVDFGRALINTTLDQYQWEMYRFMTCTEA